MQEGTNGFRRIRPTNNDLPLLLKEAIENPLAVQRELNNRSLYHFLKYFWELASQHPFQANWHIEYLCRELEKVANNVGKRIPREYDLIINVPPGSTKPLHEETDVLMGDGSYKKLKDIVKGDFVINKFGNPTEVTGVHIQGNLPCINIRTFGGRNIKSAYDHPFLTADGWRNAIDITEGQMLALMHTPKIEATTERSIDEFKLAGYLVGDGSISQTNCRVCGTDMEYLKDLTDCVDRLGYGWSKFIDKNGVTNISLRTKIGDKVKAGTYKGLGRGFRALRGPRRWLKDIGIYDTNSRTKKVPDFIYKGTDDQIKAFLVAYFHCDGCISYKSSSSKRNVVVSMTTISKELAIGIQRLFLRVGVPLKIRYRIQKNGYAYNPNLKDYVYYTIDTTDQDSAVRFLEKIPLIGYKLEKLKAFAPRRRTFDQEYWPDEVVSIEKIGELPCRCLSVSKGESFVADGVVVHNTICASIMFPAWCWTKWPHMRFITASYSGALSLESAEYCRELIRSEKFQEMYPDIAIKEDKDTKSNYRIVKKEFDDLRLKPKETPGGSRYSTSVGGTLTGFHGDILIVDDPLNPSQAVSDIELANANNWMEQTLSTRKTDKAITPTILIMQRLNQDDPTGHMLEKQKENVKHVCIPGEIRNFRMYASPPEIVDYYKDDLMDPKRLPWSVLKDLEADLGQYGYAGQIGQNPTPPGGGMFKVDRMGFLEQEPVPNSILKTVRYWDKAGTEGAGDYTVGVRMSALASGKWLIEDMKRGRWGSHEREAIIRATAEADGTRVHVWVEQEAGSGGKESAEGTIRNLAGYIVKAERPTGDKIFRADPFSVQVNNGNVLILKGNWNQDLLSEFRFFPYGTHDDIVDSCSGCFSKLVQKKIARRIT